MARIRRESVPTSAVPTRFSKSELARVDRVRSALGLPSRSAVIRRAVLDLLEQVESARIVEVRDVTVPEAERLIERYMKDHPGTRYVSDIADEMGIELHVAFEAARRMLDRGRLRVREE